ncbi:MAG TPA: hypothetical protein VII19_06905 [Acidimicrobiales bacterium]
MTVSGSGIGPQNARSRTENRAERERRQMERRRRRQRRLLPLGVLSVVVIALIVWRIGGRGATTSAPPAAKPVVTTTTTRPPYVPPAVKPTISPPLAGEGQWVTQDAWSPAPPAIMTTTFRPDPAQPNIVAYASWMRATTTQLALYPGYKGPGPSPLDRGPEMVPVAARSTLLATFNSGFYEADAAAGFYTHGALYFPMVNGLATVVTYADGKVDIVDWQGGPAPGSDIVMARQNLPLLVDGGAATAASAVPSQWGVTLGGVPAVWRTGLGVDAMGNLIYVAASAQTAAGLAQILVQLGAVRGMQLDINPEWPIFVTYGGPNAAAPALFVPNPNQTPDRFLYSSTKDFFAVYQRVPGVVQQPW